MIVEYALDDEESVKTELLGLLYCQTKSTYTF